MKRLWQTFDKRLMSTAAGFTKGDALASYIAEPASEQIVDRTSKGILSDDSGSQHGSGSLHVHTIHGLLLALAFFVLYPLALIGLRYGSRLCYHWVPQILVSIIAVIAISMGAWLVVDSGRSPFTLHFFVGFLCALIVVLQPLSGVLHHKIFVRRGQASRRHRRAHVWPGRLLWILAMLNTGM